MTHDPQSVQPGDTLQAAARVMDELDAADRLAGIVSLGDLADAGTPEAAAKLEVISTPAAPDR